MPDSSTFAWLHLTDLHQGMGGQSWMWPSVREAFFDDLGRVHDRSGPFEVVLFTGDLTQRGTDDEFARLDETLAAVWTRLAELGSTPGLLAVPGNHDLVRPRKLSSTYRVLSNWSEHSDAHAELWADPESEYRDAIETMFAPFRRWWTARAAQLPEAWTYREGVLPGDWSVQIPVGPRTVGVLGLNSSYVQLWEGDFHGKLHLDTRQFGGACEGDGPAWAKQNDLSLLLTHHGPDWLSPGARDEHLRSDIDVPPRFLAHLYGHMHGHALYGLSEGGGRPRRRWQGSSMFGLEWIEDTVERAHGYAAGRVMFEAARANFRMWPRSAGKVQGGYWKLRPDPQMDLDDDGGTHEDSVPVATLAPPPTASTTSTTATASPSSPSSPGPGPDPDQQGRAVAAGHFQKIEAYKALHDQFHNIEFECLRPLRALPAGFQLRAALWGLERISRDIDARVEPIDRVLGRLLTMQLGRALTQLREAVAGLEGATPTREAELIGGAIEELQVLLGQLPSDLEQHLSEATRALHRDPRLDGIEHLEQLRRELEGRVEEHSWLQKIDGELRGPRGGRYHWDNVTFMLAELDPVSDSLRAAWEVIGAERDRLRTFLADPSHDAELQSEALENFGQLIAGVFRNVDAELKLHLGRLLESPGTSGASGARP